MSDTELPTTSETSPFARPLEALAKGVRNTLLISGIVAIIGGIVLLAWPEKAIVAVTAIIAAYAVVAGIVYIVLGLISKHLGTGGRVATVLLGVLFLVAGIYAFTSLQQTAAFLTVFVAILVGVLWLVEGFVTLFSIGESPSKVFTVVYAIVSILAGFSLVSSPLWGAVALWWFFAIALIVLGVLNVVRAIRIRTAS
ncbi:hypothetical protein F8O01_01730 [Pseudoclavibacter chungangensis]|uniref:HdeD family acid-resistance protein n=1 Tax=Pseudoclavibacter chungangensis TaxID=587635 RepID=A0A7J5C362_9MICO|nr:DUF308 domain-containing protein [Pseudoclavibacter chungangensis]KAB1662208.1 hypothetical protein F8O01_01730 [Pseudoclavibacter chungangensis]NYJ65405.1 uncharacterized membrane protein HdeD (DUF308 family) [Pseudoclavibacter chungangensis]